MLGFSVSFYRGTVFFAKGEANGNKPGALTLFFSVPWVYYSSDESDGWGGSEKVFAINAPTELFLAKEESIQYVHRRVKLLGFGVGYTFQVGY